MEKTINSYYWDGNEYIKNVPSLLDLEINTTCNSKCAKCFRHNDFYVPENEYMTLFFAKIVISEFAQKGGHSIRFIERGEPTLSPILVDVVKYAHERGLRTMINTNCKVLTPELSKKLIDAGISMISCDVDSCEKETYEILQGKSYEKVIENIKALYQYGKNKMRIEIHMNLQPENKQEAESGKFEQFFSQYAHKVGIDRSYDLTNFDFIGIEGKACIEPWRRLIVLVNGDVILCPAGINYKTKKIHDLGNLHDKSLQDIWKGKEMEQIREWHKEQKPGLYEPCGSCRLRRYIKELKK